MRGCEKNWNTISGELLVGTPDCIDDLRDVFPDLSSRISTKGALAPFDFLDMATGGLTCQI
jgi:hypothetical protein